MAQSLGKNAIVQIAGVNVSTYINQTDFNRVCNLLDSHTFGDTAVEKVPGLSDATMGMSGPYDDSPAATNTIDLTLNSCYTASIPGGTGYTMQLYPVGTASGKAYYTGTAFLGNEKLGIPVGGTIGWSMDHQFSGGATRTLVV